MSLLIFSLVVLLIAAIAALILRRFAPEFGDIGSLVILLVALIVIARQAGIF